MANRKSNNRKPSGNRSISPSSAQSRNTSGSRKNTEDDFDIDETDWDERIDEYEEVHGQNNNKEDSRWQSEGRSGSYTQLKSAEVSGGMGKGRSMGNRSWNQNENIRRSSRNYNRNEKDDSSYNFHSSDKGGGTRNRDMEGTREYVSHSGRRGFGGRNRRSEKNEQQRRK